MEKDENIRFGSFLWRVASSHVLAYSFAGLFAVLIIDYGSLYSLPPLSYFMKQLDSPIVALAPVLQILRGTIIALVLWFFKDTFIKADKGYLKLFILFFGLSYVSTIGPTLGSFDGYLFTTFSLRLHLIGLPEALIYITVFSLYLHFWYKLEKRIFFIISVVMYISLVLTSFLGYMAAIGVIESM